MAQLFESPTLAQVIISQFMSWSPTFSSLLSTQSLLWVLCPPLSLSLPNLCFPKNKKTFLKSDKKKKRNITKVSFQDFCFVLFYLFIFCLKYPRLETGKAGSPEMPMEAEEQLFFVTKGKERSSLKRQKTGASR